MPLVTNFGDLTVTGALNSTTITAASGFSGGSFTGTTITASGGTTITNSSITSSGNVLSVYNTTNSGNVFSFTNPSRRIRMNNYGFLILDTVGELNGVSEPQALLDIKTEGAWPIRMYDNDNNERHFIAFDSPGNNTGFLIGKASANNGDATDSRFSIRVTDGNTVDGNYRTNTEVFSIYRTGQVSVGDLGDSDTTFTEKFFVDGSVRASTSISANDFYGIYHAPSDDRLKNKLENIPSALDKVKTLNGFKFLWKDANKGTDEHVGLSAQEVQKVLPQVVKQNGEYLNLQYDKLVPLLVEAIKELAAEVENLKAAKI